MSDGYVIAKAYIYLILQLVPKQNSYFCGQNISGFFDHTKLLEEQLLVFWVHVHNELMGEETAKLTHILRSAISPKRLTTIPLNKSYLK